MYRIGPNNSGKTSILEAIQALCRSVDYPLEQAFVGSWKSRELVWRGEKSGVVSLAATVCEDDEEFEYQLRCAFLYEHGRAVRNYEETFNTDGTIDLTHKHRTPCRP